MNGTKYRPNKFVLHLQVDENLKVCTFVSPEFYR